MSTKDVLFKRRVTAVEIDGGTVYVRSLTLRQAAEFDRLMESGKNFEAALYSVVQCLVEEDGTAVFGADDDSANDIPIDTLYSLSTAIAEVSSAAKAKDIRKNSDAVPLNQN